MSERNLRMLFWALCAASVISIINVILSEGKNSQMAGIYLIAALFVNSLYRAKKRSREIEEENRKRFINDDDEKK